MKKILTILMVFASLAGFAAPMKLEPAQQKKFNIFFSNFAETNMEGFKQEALSDDAMLNFALRHLYINKFKSLKKGKDGNSVIATMEQIDTATMKYFGKKIQNHKENTYTIPCADGEAFRFSQLDSLEDRGNNTFKAEGTIYSTGSGGTPDVHGTPADWKKAGEEVSVAGRFSAVVKSEGERYILVEYFPTDSESAKPQADTTQEPASDDKAQGKVAIDELKSIMQKDIFAWQLLDENGKLALLNQIKRIWQATGDETDKNAIDTKVLKDKMTLGDQANIFESACEAAGIKQAPYQAMCDKAN